MIKDLECFAFHGVLKEEQILGQKFLVSLVLYTDIRNAGLNDNLEETINYAEVCTKVQEFMKEKRFLLIEAVAEQMANMLLKSFDLLKKVTITIKKPWAPVHYSMDAVAVEITREWHVAYLAIGANQGNREQNIQVALSYFKENPMCKLEKVSSIVPTKPYGVKEQDDFLNGVFCIKTLLTPEEILGCIQEIEQKLERKREMHWGPRTIDVDILLYDNLVCRTEKLCIPHIEMQKRDFVLKPLCEIAPYAWNPVQQKTAKEMWEELKYSDDYEVCIK